MGHPMVCAHTDTLSQSNYRTRVYVEYPWVTQWSVHIQQTPCKHGYNIIKVSILTATHTHQEYHFSVNTIIYCTLSELHGLSALQLYFYTIA